MATHRRLLLLILTMLLHANIRAQSTHPSKAIQKDTTDTNAIIKESDIGLIFVQGGTYNFGDFMHPGKFVPVTVSSFYISKYEITQKQWKIVMHDNSSAFLGCDNCPVENVTYDQVQDFLAELSRLIGKKYRLPTDAEWEFAARGGIYSKHYRYSGSNNIDEVAWYAGNTSARTHRVGMKKPNELGIYDMCGNVAEWCSNWVGNMAIRDFPIATLNPKGPPDGYDKVIRGGSFLSSQTGDDSDISLHYNSVATPIIHTEYIGFRLVRDAP